MQTPRSQILTLSLRLVSVSVNIYQHSMFTPPLETSMAQVMLELAWEEDEAASSGDQVLSHKVSPVNFVKQGLHIEEQQ